MNRLRRAARTGMEQADAFFNRLYGWRGNPLYHSGALAVASFCVLLLTGIYLLLFYRVGSPWSSVSAITGQAWAGRWIRSLHRYASDVVVAAVLLHAFRMFAQGRSWGPRALAWVSGLVLLFVVFACGWTGYVMVWDAQARLLAVEGARLLDVIPVFSEPIVRAFSGESPMPGAFFFLNLFLHIALPIGVALILWVHVSRVARPGLLPPRPLLWAAVGLLVIVSVVWPVAMAPEATAFRLPLDVPVDLFYGFFLPVTARVSPGWAWVVGGVAAVGLLLAPS
ncbi:MAG TPA: cytochrome b N-terminal domain-containing protein, partial [Longimicrobiales bacterium]|nr:cytochrome b N-terminal domain-containing protein [Longimicrobiales bacterium]